MRDPRDMPSVYGELAWWTVMGTVAAWFVVPYLYVTIKGRGGGVDFMAFYLVVASTLIGIGILTWCFVRARRPYRASANKAAAPAAGTTSGPRPSAVRSAGRSRRLAG